MSSLIITCTDCSGHGVKRWVENIPGHNLETIRHEDQCLRCEGSGRVVQTITYEPFRPRKVK